MTFLPTSLREQQTRYTFTNTLPLFLQPLSSSSITFFIFTLNSSISVCLLLGSDMAKLRNKSWYMNFAYHVLLPITTSDSKMAYSKHTKRQSTVWGQQPLVKKTSITIVTSRQMHKCRYYVSSHPSRQCPPYGKTCRQCTKEKHFKAVCRSTEAR